MTGWSTFTIDDVLAQFNDSETSAYEQAKGEVKGTSFGDIITKVAQQVVKAYQDGGREVDSQAGTVPDGEKNRAVSIARWKFLLAIPSGESLAKYREADAKAAEDYFLMIAKRELKGSGGAEIVSKTPRVATRDRLNGLQ
jgi:hypothetical protein